MSAKYCYECGNPINIGFKFCGECGVPVTAEAKAKLANKPKVKPRVEPIMDDEDAGVDDDDSPSMDSFTPPDKLDVEIESFSRKSTKIGEIVGTRKQEIYRDKPSGKTTRKQFLQEWQKEAGTLRKK